MRLTRKTSLFRLQEKTVALLLTGAIMCAEQPEATASILAARRSPNSSDYKSLKAQADKKRNEGQHAVSARMYTGAYRSMSATDRIADEGEFIIALAVREYLSAREAAANEEEKNALLADELTLLNIYLDDRGESTAPADLVDRRNAIRQQLQISVNEAKDDASSGAKDDASSGAKDDASSGAKDDASSGAKDDASSVPKNEISGAMLDGDVEAEFDGVPEFDEHRPQGKKQWRFTIEPTGLLLLPDWTPFASIGFGLTVGRTARHVPRTGRPFDLELVLYGKLDYWVELVLAQAGVYFGQTGFYIGSDMVFCKKGGRGIVRPAVTVNLGGTIIADGTPRNGPFVIWGPSAMAGLSLFLGRGAIVVMRTGVMYAPVFWRVTHADAQENVRFEFHLPAFYSSLGLDVLALRRHVVSRKKTR